MESELERFHKSNTALELSLTELRQKLRASDIELEEERLRVRDSRSLNTRILADLHESVSLIQEPAKLKEGSFSTKIIFFRKCFLYSCVFYR